MTIWGADEDAEGYLELTIKDSAYRGFAYGWLLCIAVFVLIVALAVFACLLLIFGLGRS